MLYQEIVFMQGDDAEEPLSLLKDDVDKCFEYLLQWDYGEGVIHPIPAHGFYDHITIRDDLILSYNNCMGYIALERIIGDI